MLIYRYTAFNNIDAITRSVSAFNEGTENIDIQAIMSMNIDFFSGDFNFMHLQGTWGRERHIEILPIGHNGTNIQSRRGASSHNHSPFFALTRNNTDEKNGEAYGFSLVYSGNFEAGVEVDHHDTLRAYMGINSFDFNWLLTTGERFDAPEVVMVYSNKGIGTMSRTFHNLYRSRLCRGKFRDEPRPVLINNWEATYMDFNEEKILDIASVAKSVGIELMVLDDGWFGKRDDCTSSLGDWYPNFKKLPNGVSGLARKITDMGMRFGLWFEPEMISPDSDLYRAHPNWCIHVKDRERHTGRLQLILDLSREDVCKYIIDFLSKTLDECPITYIKWDMNRNMSEIGSELLPPEKQAETAHRYMLNLYKILETITTKYPDVLFEGCSGGGGRFDAGMLPYFIQYWTSDDTDAIERMKIQEGTSIVMPACTMGAHVSAVPNHQNGRTTPFSTRGNTAMCGQFGYELDITKMSVDELKEIEEQIKTYKTVRNTIHYGEMYRLRSPRTSNKIVWEYVSQDKSTIVVYAAVILYELHKLTERIRLDGLEPDSVYKIRNTEQTFSGSTLMNCGIPLTDDLITDFSSKIVILDKIK